MASAAEPQLLRSSDIKSGGGGGLNGGAYSREPPTMPTPQPPPSPPATETDIETDSEAPNAPPVQRGPEANDGLRLRIDDMRDANTAHERTSDSPVTSPVTSPPYWTHNPPSHARTVSSTSADSIPRGGITLMDNETSSIDERGNACWARSVQVTDYVIVNGSTTNIGAFVVWNIRVETLTVSTALMSSAGGTSRGSRLMGGVFKGSFMNIRKRYSEFDDFRWRLMRTFPGFEAAVPGLPPKSLISKFRPRFLEKRRSGIQYFLNCILLNPEFSGSPVLKEFLFS
ncbi:Uu.00g029120.m01.CDS01 [Anthostomella pinea]|uniref:Endosomal/vacuolar adapter protein YPT35 n=1 Tax=Anthostomella pinea TaxID=933095 RepID=A0AAI8V816_9PEZI|nr:Uu.00g029120.m01.CDS01 [Anthostomella pinea]